MSDEELGVLRRAAFAALDNAYAPYSGFRVGAALLGDADRVFAGCNVESVAYPSGICAERAAVAAAVAGGSRSFRALVVATEAGEPTPPCGMCRQVLVEFSPALEVVSVTRGGREARWSMRDLLPRPFTPASMERA